MVLNLDMTTEVVDISGTDNERLDRINKILDGYFDVATLMTGVREHITVQLLLNDVGLLLELPPNKLATSLRGMFMVGQARPLVGTAILSAYYYDESCDLPQEWIDLVNALKAVVT